jgi:phosphoserine phosphatase
MTATVLVLQHPDIARCDLSGLPSADLVSATVARIKVDAGFSLSEQAAAALAAQQIDYAVLPDRNFADLGLIVSDMDSTLITIECIDEIAAGVGLKDKVAEITERSMRGEMDFAQSLTERVALLEGLDEGVLQSVYDNVLKLSPGAEYLITECKRHDVKFLLVSGGFTFFTDRLQQQLGIDYAYANVLEIVDGKLTGKLKGRMIDAQAKADLLRQHQEALGLTPEQVLAVGDGANDIPMLQAAGIGVAYHAKPKTEQHADVAVRFNGLEALRGLFA